MPHNLILHPRVKDRLQQYLDNNHIAYEWQGSTLSILEDNPKINFHLGIEHQKIVQQVNDEIKTEKLSQLQFQKGLTKTGPKLR